MAISITNQNRLPAAISSRMPFIPTAKRRSPREEMAKKRKTMTEGTAQDEATREGTAGGAGLDISQSQAPQTAAPAPRQLSVNPEVQAKTDALAEFNMRQVGKAVKMKPKLQKRSIGEQRADILYGKANKSGYERDSGMKWLKENNPGDGSGGNPSRRASYQKAANKVRDRKALQAVQAEDTRQADDRFAERGNSVEWDVDKRRAFKDNEQVGKSDIPMIKGARSSSPPMLSSNSPANILNQRKKPGMIS